MSTIDNNPWKAVAQNTKELWSQSVELVFPGDEKAVHLYNERNAGHRIDNRFLLNLPPEPFQGNPLKSDVIILSLNPGFVDNANRLFAQLLQGCHKHGKNIEELVLEEKRKNMILESDGFLPQDPDARTSINVLGDFYWYNRLRQLSQELNLLYDEDKLLEFINRFALVQYIPYTSKSFEGLQKKEKLASHDFVREVLIKAEQSENRPIFLVMRCPKQWKLLLGDSLWNRLQSDNRLVVNPNCKFQWLTKKNLGEGFQILESKLNDKR